MKQYNIDSFIAGITASLQNRKKEWDGTELIKSGPFTGFEYKAVPLIYLQTQICFDVYATREVNRRMCNDYPQMFDNFD